MHLHLGVESLQPFFAIVLFLKTGSVSLLGFDGFLKRRIPGKNGEGLEPCCLAVPTLFQPHAVTWVCPFISLLEWIGQVETFVYH